MLMIFVWSTKGPSVEGFTLHKEDEAGWPEGEASHLGVPSCRDFPGGQEGIHRLSSKGAACAKAWRLETARPLWGRAKKS